jgi:hypothetical protein
VTWHDHSPPIAQRLNNDTITQATLAEICHSPYLMISGVDYININTIKTLVKCPLILFIWNSSLEVSSNYNLYEPGYS